MPINAGTVYSELVLDTSKYNEGIEKAQKQMNALAADLKKNGDKMAKIGKDMTKKVTLPIVGVGAAALKSSIDFESAFAGVRKTVDATEEEFARLSTGIRDMSKEIPASATAIAEVAEAAGQLGIKTENILGFTRVMIDLGEATNLSADEAATAFARFANIVGMSQQDFDRLGSTVVELGNNLATTETEIVAMAMRLAGAGKQIRLSEAEIMAFAGALSSVGIEAEAGGSAFSRLMVQMQLAVETGSNSLRDFAQVAGMSAGEFQRAFRDDAAGAIIAFIEGLSTAEERGLSAIKVLDDMGITEIRLRDALLRAAGASGVFAESLEIGTQAWAENSALAKEAAQRYETTASQLSILRNRATDAGISLGEKLLPHLIRGMEIVEGWIEGLNNLSPSMQDSIIKTAAFAAAIGPLLLVGGKAVSGVGSAIKLLGTLGKAMTATTTATVAGTTATTGLASSLSAAGLAAKAGALLLNPWTLGIGAVVGAGVMLHNHLRQEAIPSVNLFSSAVSESTKKAVSSFFEMADGVTQSLNELNFRGQAITAEMAEGITSTYAAMTGQIYERLDSHYNESLQHMRQFFANSKGLTEAEQAEMLAKMEKHHADQRQSVADNEARIKEILERASSEKRALTREEQQEINQIQQQMKETAVRVLSENEIEARAILERMKQHAGDITARQAAEVVQNSAAQRDGAIAAAQEQYEETIRTIIRLRDEAGVISREQADTLIKEAGRQRDEAVAKAREMHEMVVSEAQKQAKGHIDTVDWETGEILSIWQRFARSLERIFANMPSYKGLNVPGSGSFGQDPGAVGQNARGTQYWRGGLTWVGEQGPELIELPRGTKVYTAQESERIAAKMGNITQHITINSPSPLTPSEVARQTKLASQLLAMEWGLRQ